MQALARPFGIMSERQVIGDSEVGMKNENNLLCMILWHVKGHKLKMVRIGDVEKQPFTDHHRCSILLLGGFYM